MPENPERPKWLRMDADDGWQIVIPESDILPHTDLPPDQIEKLKAAGNAEVELAGMTCPCKPKVSVLDKIIVHNSFEDCIRVQEAMDRLV